MAGPKPCLGYQSRTEAVKALRQKGLLTREIAVRIGIDAKTVTALEASGTRTRTRTSPTLIATRGQAIADLFPYHQKELLREHAARRALSTSQLIQAIVERVIEDDLINAVLDDGRSV